MLHDRSDKKKSPRPLHLSTCRLLQQHFRTGKGKKWKKDGLWHHYSHQSERNECLGIWQLHDRGTTASPPTAIPQKYEHTHARARTLHLVLHRRFRPLGLLKGIWNERGRSYCPILRPCCNLVFGLWVAGMGCQHHNRSLCLLRYTNVGKVLHGHEPTLENVTIHVLMELSSEFQANFWNFARRKELECHLHRGTTILLLVV